VEAASLNKNHHLGLSDDLERCRADEDGDDDGNANNDQKGCHAGTLRRGKIRYLLRSPVGDEDVYVTRTSGKPSGSPHKPLSVRTEHGESIKAFIRRDPGEA